METIDWLKLLYDIIHTALVEWFPLTVLCGLYFYKIHKYNDDAIEIKLPKVSARIGKTK